MVQFDMIRGVYLLGILLNTFLYGLVFSEFLAYFRTKSSDALWLRVVVGALLVGDTIHSAVEVYAACRTSGQDGNPTSLPDLTWIIPFTVVATSVSAIMTQIFLAHRVLKLTQNNLLVGALYFASALSLVFGCVAGAMLGLIKQVANFRPLVPFVVLWLGLQTLADFAITASLIVPLTRSRTGFRKTDAVINQLIQGAFQTGTFASLFALADLFAFIFWRNTNLYAMFVFPIGRIYTNTLLHTLNARGGLKGMDDNFIDCDTESLGLLIVRHRRTLVRSVRPVPGFQ
ncbi:hypothetical protein DFH06DRAFT_1301762 [Mycena polygramma]|nr:hypothetical protein DFH06DRAFT_1301762 [Mycena polygramma]